MKEITFLFLLTVTFNLNALEQQTPLKFVNAPATRLENTPPSDEEMRIQKTFNETKNVIKKEVENLNKDNKKDTSRFISSYEFIITVMILSFAAVIMISFIYLFTRDKIQSYQIVKLSIITMIIFSTLILITVGYDNNQIAPAMGLLGTIAGYILGKQYTPDIIENQPPAQTDTTGISTIKK